MIVARFRLLFSAAIALVFAGPAIAGPVNAITNGDFEAGNTGFGSDYNYSPANNTAESQYTIRTNPYPWNPNFAPLGDHTTGTGSMFVGNGAPVDQRVWFASGIAVNPGSDYEFEAFAINVVSPSYAPGNDPSTFSILSFYANGALLGIRTTRGLGNWEGLSTTWNSGAATTVDLEIRNANFAVLGNDFAIDDISLTRQTSITGAVPEPSTLALLGMGGVAAAIWSRRRSLTARR